MNMVTVRKVEGKRDVKRFVEFPLKLYKNCPYFVPPIYADEKKLIASGANSDNYESVFFLAERDGEVVGRIHGILQKQYNEKNGERRIRFTRFDSINDKEVSRALFATLEDWGRERNMTELCGPLGFSDLDREGLLIEGFSEDSTFEEQYNYEYYAELIEDVGLKKEVDWLEFELKAPEKKNEMLGRVAQRTLELHRLHVVDPNMPKKEYIAKYGEGFFACLDECYKKLYGTVPISEEQKKELISQFMLIINPKYLVFICDENERVVAFGLCFPAIGEALKKSGGRLTPLALIKLLRLARKPKSIDPMYGIIDMFRAAIIHSTEFMTYFSVNDLIYCSAFALICCAIGFLAFYKKQDKFILHI